MVGVSAMAFHPNKLVSPLSSDIRIEVAGGREGTIAGAPTTALLVQKQQQQYNPTRCRLRSFTVGGNIPTTTTATNLIIGFGSGSRSGRIAPTRCSSALTPEYKTTLDKVVTSHKVVLFMKGTKEFPQCGFSNTVVQILKSLNAPFETINILENEMLRQGLKEYSSWPTFPQLYIDGEFFGGCDITVEAYKNGQLQEVLEKALCS